MSGSSDSFASLNSIFASFMYLQLMSLIQALIFSTFKSFSEFMPFAVFYICSFRPLLKRYIFSHLQRYLYHISITKVRSIYDHFSRTNLYVFQLSNCRISTFLILFYRTYCFVLIQIQRVRSSLNKMTWNKIETKWNVY